MSSMYSHLSGRSRNPFSSRAIARSGRSGAARVGLGEKDRAEPVGDVEPRIERRRDVEQRIQQRVGVGAARPSAADRVRHRAGRVEPLLGAAVVLNRADPVEIRGERRVGAGEPAQRVPERKYSDSSVSVVAADTRARAPPAAGRRRRAAPRRPRRFRRSTAAGTIDRSFEVPPRKDEHRNRQQHRDVERRVRDGHRDVAERHR